MTRAAVHTRQRYRILCDLGFESRKARSAASRIWLFVEYVREKGRDPVEFGELAVRRQGGKPRVDTPKSRRFKAWYDELRELGASSVVASEASQSPVGYRLLKKQLLDRQLLERRLPERPPRLLSKKPPGVDSGSP